MGVNPVRKNLLRRGKRRLAMSAQLPLTQIYQADLGRLSPTSGKSVLVRQILLDILRDVRKIDA